MKYVDLMIEWSLAYMPKVLMALVVLYGGFRVVGMVTKLMHKAFQHEKIDESLGSFLESLVGIGLKGLVLITVANMVGIQMTSFIALLGAAGLAIGLSLQGSLSNLAGGVLILLFKPFKVGDMIETHGHFGRVSSIQIANTILKTTDNRTVIIPNGEISNGSLENYSTEGLRRLDMVFGIGYGDDIAKAKSVLKDIIEAQEFAMKDPEPLIAVTNLAASSVDIECRMWCKGEDYHALRFAMNEAVKLTFDEKGISFPFPQRDVNLTLNSALDHALVQRAVVDRAEQSSVNRVEELVS